MGIHNVRRREMKMNEDNEREEDGRVITRENQKKREIYTKEEEREKGDIKRKICG